MIGERGLCGSVFLEGRGKGKGGRECWHPFFSVPASFPADKLQRLVQHEVFIKRIFPIRWRLFELNKRGLPYIPAKAIRIGKFSHLEALRFIRNAPLKFWQQELRLAQPGALIAFTWRCLGSPKLMTATTLLIFIGTKFYYPDCNAAHMAQVLFRDCHAATVFVLDSSLE